MKFYGSLNNRLEENKMLCETIEVGTGATIYSWSDCNAYEVVKVDNQKHCWIREYDHKHIGDGHMDNSWELVSNENNSVIEIVKRYGYWHIVNKFTEQSILKGPVLGMTEKECEALKKKGYFIRYSKINISFGVAKYYFDYEF